MAEILHFPVKEAHDNGMERYLMASECMALGLIDPFANWVETLDGWFAEHPQACTKRNEALRSLLADTWLVFHIACDQNGRLEMLPHHWRRWAQLQYQDLSDFELLIIVSDNLTDLRRGIAEICQQYPPEARSDLNLYAVTQGIERLQRQLDHLLDPDISASSRTEWTP